MKTTTLALVALAAFSLAACNAEDKPKAASDKPASTANAAPSTTASAAAPAAKPAEGGW